MTRKVTAYCFRKRLLLLPYIYKLCLSQIAHINTTIHHYVDKTDTYHNRKQRKTVHYSHANGTSVLYRTMCPLSPRMLLAERLQKRVKLIMWLVQHVCVCLKSLCTLRSQYPIVVRIVGNDVSSKVSIFFACTRTFCYDLPTVLLPTDNSIHTLARCSILLNLEVVNSKFGLFNKKSPFCLVHCTGFRKNRFLVRSLRLQCLFWKNMNHPRF